MPRTDEQNLIIHHQGNARVKAGAGTGKTFTLTEYVKARPYLRFLYIVYNRSARIEGSYRFEIQGIKNVRVETAHSLAHKEFDVRRRFKLHPSGGLRPHEIVELMKVSKRDKSIELIYAKHILSVLSLYCNSNVTNINDIDYLNTIKDEKIKRFVNHNLNNIYDSASNIMSMMNAGTLDMSHDCYMKLWQLTKPKLNYDVILFDEGQDASPVMLDIFLNQDAIKIIVGDENQQIYGYRSAVNSLNYVDYPEFYLTNSFRYTQEIADIAMDAISLKKLIGQDVSNVKLTGLGGRDESNTMSAVLARNNLTLLSAAIEYVFDEGGSDLYFEGNLNSYTYMREGGGLYDIINLFKGKNDRIRDKLISSFNTIDELIEYQGATGDQELGLMLNMVKKYKSNLSFYLSKLKEYQVSKDKAKLIFSTVHKAKGMEYNHVRLCDDFISREKIEKLIESGEADNALINEEINILYVAATRARYYLDAPEFL